MAAFPNQEHRPLKKLRLEGRSAGVGPDVYLQDKRQKEDELNQMSVKHGFTNVPVTKDEHGSAKDCVINLSKVPGKDSPVAQVAAAFNAILAKKQDNNTFQDQSKRKLVINTKDNFWLAGIPWGKMSPEGWIKDLAGPKSLTQLAKKVPIFNKKEEIFQKLFDENVPFMRAAWYIKMTNAYHTALSEEKKAKKRQTSDPFLEWTLALTKFLHEQLQKILDHYKGTGAPVGFLTATPVSVVDVDATMRQWNYGMQLAQHMYDEGLLDRHEFLSWLIELLEKVKVADDTVLKLIMNQILRYMSEFVQSHLLSRRLAYFCAKRLSQICADSTCLPSPNAPSPAVVTSTASNDMACSSSASATSNGTSNGASQGSATPVNSIISVFTEFSSCPQHRSLLLGLCAIIQSITISCPSALVWHNLGDGKQGSPLNGSPLDLLPCSPSSLPMPSGKDNNQIRMQLRAAEKQVIARSIAVEVRWSSDKRQQSTKGQVINHVLSCLEMIDKHNFEKVEMNNSLDVLYHKLFANRQTNKDGNEPTVIADEAIINLLLEWAVSPKRAGDHRAVVVAKLLEKYQNDLASEKSADGEGADEHESTGSDMVSSTVPMFQCQLMQFLDAKAPVLDENPTVDNRQAFANLVLLFTELIRHDVFSHDAYVCALISRGDLPPCNSWNAFAQISSVNPDHSELSSVKSEGIKQEAHDEMKMELETSDFGFFGFKDEPKHSPDRPASVMSSMDQSIIGMTPSQVQVPTPSAFHGQGMARTPGAPMTPISARTPGGAPHTPGTAHTPGVLTPGSATPGGGSGFHTSVGCHSAGMVHTPVSVLPPAYGTPSAERPRLHRGPPRHLVFLTHFPIPNDDQFSHESNQRMVVLYGVGRQRDEARHLVKKVTKEITKLFGKKNCLDLSGGDPVVKAKKKKDKDGDPVATLENTFAKFRKLSYYDQHAVTQTVAKSLSEAVNAFASGTVNYLPQLENISFLFDLMEYCLNISQLLDLAIQLLKDLPGVDNQLTLKAQGLLTGLYSTSLGLFIVGILRKFHACLLVLPEQTASAFESLCKVVKHVDKPSDCTSAERAILAYLYDLYTSCSYLKSKFSELFGGPCAKVKCSIYAEVEASSSNLRWEEHFSKDLMDNPKMKVDQQFIKQLNEAPANRYSFVCSALVNICNCQRNNDRLNDISILCAELTACCNALSSDWLGVLKALCWSSNHNCGFIDVLTQVDVDFSIHDSLAVFTAILIARHCFTLEDLIRDVALHSLLAASPSVGSGGDPDAETGARLTCHLLLRLFQMMNASPGGGMESRRAPVSVKSSCDRHLLEAAHKRINVGAVVAVLKAILVLGDSSSAEMKDRTSPNKKENNMACELFSKLFMNLDDDPDDRNMSCSNRSKGRMDSAGLSDYAKHCLREICSQEWVREKFLKEPEQLFSSDHLLDKMLSHRQAEQLVQMICYPGGIPSVMMGDDDDDDEPEQRRHITRILHNVDQWSQRVSWLELQLMIKQASASEMSPLLDSIAKSTIEVFQQQTVIKQEVSMGNISNMGSSSSIDSNKDSVWLIAPLIAKLSSAVQGRILRTAGQVLETGNNFWAAKNSKDRERYLQKSTSLLGNQPFLSLVLTCLRGQDEQREVLLKSLHDQLEKFVTNAKEQQERVITTDEKLQYMMQEALHLRLSLVGNMFDTIQRNNNLTQEWAILLIQLISSGVIDIQNNSELFTIMVDMLAILVHGTLASDSSEKGEENKKVYQSLIRKLKKELGERKSMSIDFIRQLLPLPKMYSEVIVSDPIHSSSNDARGGGTVHKPGNDIDQQRKQGGLQISRKERASPWDILEGHKNATPLSLSWFGAVRLEKKPLKYEEQHRLLLYHTHSMKKPMSYFLEPIQLPSDDLEPPPDKLMHDTKVLEHQMIMDPSKQQLQQPDYRSGSRAKAKARPNRRTPANAGTIPGTPGTPGRINPQGLTYMQQPTMGSMPFVRPDMYPQGPGGNWYPAPPPQYSAHMPPGMPRTTGFGNPREALRATVVRGMRQPVAPYMPPGPAAGGAGGNWNMSPVRPHPGGVLNRMARPPICIDPPLYGQQSAVFSNVAPQGMGQGNAYGTYAQQMPSSQSAGGMMEPVQQMSQQFANTPYQGGPGAGGSGPNMGAMQQASSGQQPAGYINPQQTGPGGVTPQGNFNPSSSRFSQMPGSVGNSVNAMSTAGNQLPGYGQQSVGPGRQHGGISLQTQQNMYSSLRQQQQQMHMAAIQQQRQQQQQQQQQMAGHAAAAAAAQQNPSSVMSMQRQMPGGQQQQQQQNSQFGNYQSYQ